MHYRPHAVLIELRERVGDEQISAGRALVTTAREIAVGVPVIAIGPAHQFASVAESSCPIQDEPEGRGDSNTR